MGERGLSIAGILVELGHVGNPDSALKMHQKFIVLGGGVNYMDSPACTPFLG